MLLILAHRNDAAAQLLAERWHGRGCVILTARNLSEPGWQFKLPALSPSRFVIEGRTFSSLDLRGVLTRVHAVSAYELSHIAPEDRSYVASEMSAFLLAWLSSLTCPVLNNPTPGCLCGPNWRLERWIHLAARLGIPIEPVHRSVTSDPDYQVSDGCRVTIAGRECIGEVHSALKEHARRLAIAAQVEVLEIQFSSAGEDARVQNASLWPDVSQPGIADALLHRFESRVP